MKYFSMLILAIAALLSASVVIATQAPRNMGGIVTAIGQNFFDQYKNVLLLNVFEDLEQETWIPYIRVLHTPMMKVNLTVSEQKFSNFTFDPAGTVFNIHSSTPQIELELKDVNLTFAFIYNITSDPWFVQDIGHGSMKVTNISPKLRGNPKVIIDPVTGEKQHKIELEYVSLPTADFESKLEGGDIANTLEYFSDTFTEFLKKEIMTNFSSSMKQALEDEINYYLYFEDPARQFPEQGFEIDYKLTDDGINVCDDFLSVIVDGTFHPLGVDETSIERYYSSMPFYESNGREVQVLVSEYSMNTILKTMIQLDTLVDDTVLDVDQILALIEDFDEPFGEQDEVRVIIKATPLDQIHTDFHPEVTITPQESIYDFSIDIHIMNPFDETVDAMVLRVQISAFISYTISDDFKLYAQAEDIEAELTELDSYFKTRSTKDSMNDRLQIARPILISYLNSILDKGIEIPLPVPVKEYIVDPRVRHFDEYLFIDAAVNFDSLDKPNEPVVKQKFEDFIL